jgi:sterol desaturase/sphingolipid hydroxylase (fatty acid hydroxylase superfamily)
MMLGLAACFAAGLLVWSLAEYLVHRFVLHGRIAALRKYHAIHHKDPLDGNGVPIVVAIQISGAVLIALYALAGWLGFAFGAGLAAGYAAYVTVHEGMHHGWFPDFNDNHEVHHTEWRFNYGVTTPFWDVVFGTFKRN